MFVNFFFAVCSFVGFLTTGTLTALADHRQEVSTVSAVRDLDPSFWPAMASDSFDNFDRTLSLLRNSHGQLQDRGQQLTASFEKTIGPSAPAIVGSRPNRALAWSATGLLWHGFALELLPFELATHDGTINPLGIDDFHRGLPMEARGFGHVFFHGVGLFYQGGQALYSYVCINQYFLIKYATPEVATAVNEISLGHDWQSVMRDGDLLFTSMADLMDTSLLCQRQRAANFLLAQSPEDYKDLIAESSLAEAQLLQQWKLFVDATAKRTALLSASMFRGGVFRHSCAWLSLVETANLTSQGAALFFLEVSDDSIFPTNFFVLAAFQQAVWELGQAFGLFRSSDLFLSHSRALDSFNVLVNQQRLDQLSLEERLVSCCFQVCFRGFPEGTLAVALREQWSYGLFHLNQGSLLWQFYEPRYRDYNCYLRSLNLSSI